MLIVGAVVVAVPPPPPLLLQADSKTSPTSATIALRQPRPTRVVLMFLAFQ
ncbi:hypothetical protein YTPLAS18_38390 [Nitrospira sp.]|nr:hypothetical protein YTPLAS18_38390 [Nitrospira sp.]